MEEKRDSTLQYMKVRTRGGSSPSGKRKVYFTCHPTDFERYFDKVCEDIFKTQDCAIYYTGDMTAPIPEQYLDSDLGQMNLFVMPVTYRLLSEPNRAMDADFAYATAGAHPISVLPLMMETGIDTFYAGRFGERQYLSPYSRDASEIGYEAKLEKYLASVLTDDATAARVRQAFDAYIFLSYRKKDRHRANELMRLIHQNPRYRDVAIWYDEFLTPGENFNQNIAKALEKSDLFALLVTPNLVNEQNYVQKVEYPKAMEAGKRILPAEMEKTDRGELEKRYCGIPACVDARNEETLDAGIREALKTLVVKPNEDDPEHNYLLGLAYLEGIDVEVNPRYAVELITSAAEAELPEAMMKLQKMYLNGERVEVDYQKALYWAKRIYEYFSRTKGENDPETLAALDNLAVVYYYTGDFQKALELHQKAYSLRCEVLGEKHPSTLISRNNLAASYYYAGDFQKALELLQKAYSLYCEVLGEKHPNTLSSLNNLAVAYGEIGDYSKKLELCQKGYSLRCEVFGEKHPDTLGSLNNLANAYGKTGDYSKKLELHQKTYSLRCEVLGEKHPDTLASLNNLAVAYCDTGDFQESLELHQKAYSLRCEVLGEKHPDTLSSLNNLAIAYGATGDYSKGLELCQSVYSLRLGVLGEKHPDTLLSLCNLANAYGNTGDFCKRLELYQKIYPLGCEIFGEKHPETLTILNNLATAYGELGAFQKSLELCQKVYSLQCEVLGERHPDTLLSLNNLAIAYGDTGDCQQQLELQQKAYSLRCEVFGEKHPDTLSSLGDLAVAYYRAGDFQKTLELCQKAYPLFREVIGATHPKTVAAKDLLNLMQEKCQNLLEEADRLSRYYNFCCTKFGEKGKATVRTLCELADVYEKLGETEKAVELRAKAAE